MSEILSAGEIELLWKRDHERKLSDDIFRFVGECLHMQSLEQSISEDSDMFNAGYEVGRKSGRQSMIEWLGEDCPHSVKSSKNYLQAKRIHCDECWQHLQKEIEK